MWALLTQIKEAMDKPKEEAAAPPPDPGSAQGGAKVTSSALARPQTSLMTAGGGSTTAASQAAALLSGGKPEIGRGGLRRRQQIPQEEAVLDSTSTVDGLGVEQGSRSPQDPVAAALLAVTELVNRMGEKKEKKKKKERGLDESSSEDGSSSSDDASGRLRGSAGAVRMANFKVGVAKRPWKFKRAILRRMGELLGVKASEVKVRIWMERLAVCEGHRTLGQIM